MRTVSVDRANRIVTRTTTAPGLANNQVEIVVNGLATTKTTPDGLIFSIAYDSLERPIAATDPRTGTVSTTYFPGSPLPKKLVDARNVTVATYTYDTMGRKVSATDAGGHTSRCAYNLRGQIIQEWGDATYPVSYDYNEYGQRTKLYTYQNENGWNGATWPGGTPSSTTTWTYDEASGLVSSKTDSANHTINFDYNFRGQVAHRYSARKLADGTPITATYTYDDITGDLLSTSYNDGTPLVSNTYAAFGLVDSITDATGTRTIDRGDYSTPWRIDSVALPAFYQNRIVTRLYEDTTDSIAGTVVGTNRGFQLGTAASTNALLEQTSAFNSLGRFASITSKRNASTTGQSFSYTYETNSRLVKSLAAAGTPFTSNNSYEPKRNLLTSIQAKWSTAIPTNYTYHYNDLGQRDTVAQSGDAFSDYTETVGQNFVYNSRGELTSATSTFINSAGTPLLPGRQFQFAYDAAGNRTSANHSSQTALADRFDVNVLNQLTGRQNHSISVSGTVGSEVFVAVNNKASDQQNNFWQSDVSLNAADPGPANKLVRIAAIKTGAGANNADLAQVQNLSLFLFPAYETIIYDDDGNLLSDGKWTYRWDAENRLISMETQTALSPLVIANTAARRLEFSYDYRGRRVEKIVRGGYNGFTYTSVASDTRFLYDGWNLVAETDAAGNFIRSYTWGLDLTGSLSATGGVGALLQITEHATNTRYFPAYDGNGNIAALVNASTGATAASYEYNAFGEPLRISGTYAHTNPIRFSSKFTDDETGLVYYGHRYYDARNGRFINRDPSEEAGGLNLYGFCGNNAVNGIDKLGLDGITWITIQIPETPFGSNSSWDSYATSAVVPAIKTSMSNAGFSDISVDIIGYGEGTTISIPITKSSSGGYSLRIGGSNITLSRSGGISGVNLKGSGFGGSSIAGSVSDPAQAAAEQRRAMIAVERAEYNRPFALSKRAGWGRQVASIGVGFLPFVGSAQSLVELISGKDYITGERANRWLAGAGLVAGLFPAGKGLLKAGSRLLRVGEATGEALARPALWRETRELIEAAATRTKAGRFVDPHTTRELTNGFHYGHVFGRENRRLLLEGDIRGLSQEQFSKWVNSNPQWFQVEGIAENLSHAFEKSGNRLDWSRVIGYDALFDIGLGSGLNGLFQTSNVLTEP